ncbi:MAG: hypothetical protein QM677_00810 [Microbacterium sp.]
MTPERQRHKETLFGFGLRLATAWWIVFGALPMVAILTASLFTGGVPEGDTAPEGYPAFMPPWWAAYPQTALLAVLAIGSLPLPLRSSPPDTRWTLAIIQACSVGTTLFVMGAAAVVEARAGRLNFFGLE